MLSRLLKACREIPNSLAAWVLFPFDRLIASFISNWFACFSVGSSSPNDMIVWWSGSIPDNIFLFVASLANDNVMALYDDGRGRLWVATYGGGLDRLDPETGKLTHFTPADGLPSASLSVGSPNTVPVPCASTRPSVAGSNPA